MSLLAIETATDDFSHTRGASGAHDAYRFHGSLERMSIVAGRVWDAHASGTLADFGLDDLRAALFMTQRGWHHDGDSDDVRSGVEWALVDAIHDASGGLVPDDRPILR